MKNGGKNKSVAFIILVSVYMQLLLDLLQYFQYFNGSIFIEQIIILFFKISIK